MKKIKTFPHNSDSFVNEFLRQTKGDIVCYNPLIVEYDPSSEYVDPFVGTITLEANLNVTHTKVNNIKDHHFIDKTKVKKIKVDAISFSTLDHNDIKFYRKGKLIYHYQISTDYMCIDLDYYVKDYSIYEYNERTIGIDNVEFGYTIYRESIWYDHFDLCGYLQFAQCRVLNLSD